MHIGYDRTLVRTASRTALLFIASLSITIASPVVAEQAPPSPQSIADAKAALSAGNVAYKKGEPAQAVEPYSRACDGGLVEGCFNLGILYSNGEGVTQDKARAAQFYDRACGGGDVRGCINLSALYEKGEGIAQDKARAAIYAKLANNPEDAKAKRALAKLNKRK